MGVLFGIFGIFMFFGFLISVASVILWIVALIDILKSKFKSDTDKIIWVAVVLILPLLGAILYFTVGKGQKIPQETE